MVFFFPLRLCCDVFEHSWYEMHSYYGELLKEGAKNKNACGAFIHPYWQKNALDLKSTLQGSPNQDLLRHPTIYQNMLRLRRGLMQEFEVIHLSYCVPDDLKNRIERLNEASFGGIPKSISEFSCTANTLGQLFHLSRILQLHDDLDRLIIVELGGGFGNLARVTKQLFPRSTYILIDLPELLAVQYVYLRNTLSSDHIVTHSKKFDVQADGHVHLVPLYLINELEVSADIFISIFALSESTKVLQQLVLDKRFFNAEIAYIVGQIGHWNEKYAHQSFVIKGTQSIYRTSICCPYHLLDQSLWAYEIIAFQFLNRF